MATITAVASGDWHTPGTWSAGSVPTVADDVYLGGYTVTLSSAVAADCLNLYMHASGATATLGRLYVTAAAATVNIASRITAGTTSSLTLGAVVFAGSCLSASVTFGAGVAYAGTTLPYGLFQRVGNYPKCVITLNGNITSPTVSYSGFIFLYSLNSSTTTYDEWIINGNVTFNNGVTNYGSGRAFINGDTCPAICVTINGNLDYRVATNGGTAGFFLNTTGTTDEMLFTVNGNVTSGGYTSATTGTVSCLRASVATTGTRGLGKHVVIDGTITGVGDYTAPVFVDTGGTLTHTGDIVVTAATYRAIDVLGGGVVSIGTVIPPASSTGVVVVDAGFNGSLTIAGLDCRTQTTSTTNKLLAFNANTVPRDVTIGTVYAGACIAAAAGANLSHRFLVSTLYGSDYTSAPTVASQPAFSTLSYPNVKTVVDVMHAGDWGSWPIAGWWQIMSSDSKIFARDTSNVVVELAVASGATVPLSTDVRDGVAVGAGVGSLVVPQVAHVLAGTVFDNGSVGTLSAATTADLAPLATAANLALVKAKTDQLAFTGGGVVADSSGVATDYTARFNSLDTVTAAVKAKTDQLAFTINGVLADAGSVDYSSRFNSLDAAVAAIPTTNYTVRFNNIDTDLDNLISGGGVDFSGVYARFDGVDAAVSAGTSLTAGVKAKTDQLAFTVDGVVADVSVSVGNVINYDARFDALDLSSTGIKAKTDQLTFTGSNVNAIATIDTSPLVTAVNSAVASGIAPVLLVTTDTNVDLALHDAEIKAQLTTIQNATGAIDLTPITTGLATVNANVLAIPTTTYTTRFNSLDAQNTTILQELADIETAVGNTSVDLSPVLSAVAVVQADTDALHGATSLVQDTVMAIKLKTDTIAPCDTSTLAGAIDALEARFASVPTGPVAIIPQGGSETTTMFGYCLNQDGSPRAGESVTIYVQQASGSGALLASAGQVKQSGVDGLVACVVPRGTQYVYAIQYGTRVERIAGVDADVLELPSIIKRD